MRHKATHFFNVPHYANKVFEFFIALLNEKLKGRILVSEERTWNIKSNSFYTKHQKDNLCLLIFYEGADNTNQMLLASTCIFKSL
jgi:hypothetical protein